MSTEALSVKKLEAVFARQTELCDSIIRAGENARKLGIPKRTIGNLNTRVERIVDSWTEFKQNHALVLPYRSQCSDNAYFKDNRFCICEEAYIESKGIILDMIKDLEKPSSRTEPPPIASDVIVPRQRQLPRIDLPSFSGRYSDWTPFRDLFTTMVVDDDSLTPVEKFQYLKISLENQPAQLIKHLSITHDNFSVAWDMLNERYENPRILIDTHLTTLLAAKPIKNESSADLNNFITEIKESLGALQTLGRPVDQWDDLLIYILAQKLDVDSIKEWEKSISDCRSPSKFSEFIKFLTDRVFALEAIEKKIDEKKRLSICSGTVSKFKGFKVHGASITELQCPLCRGEHYLMRCKTFLFKTPKQRSEYVIQQKRCFNCLGQHFLNECRVNSRCHKCSKRHHTCLHDYPPEKLNKSNSSAKDNNYDNLNLPGPSTSHQVHSFHINSSVLLATALVRVRSVRGDYFVVRALIDQGSEVSFGSESLIQRLSLPRRGVSVPINGVGSTQTCISNGFATIDLVSRYNNVLINEEILILPKLTSYVPKKHSNLLPEEIKALQLADPEYNSNRKIDLILGVKVYSRIIGNNIRKFNKGNTVAQETLFGWILFGSVSHPSPSSNSDKYVFQCSIDHELLNSIQKFWKLEDDSISINKLSTDELECEYHFKQTHSRDDSGRFTVRLPFKRSPFVLGRSYDNAVKSFNRMEHRFAQNSELSGAYQDFMQEYLTLEHMKPVSFNNNELNYYLPHHGVIRETSITTKLRVVFNGSASTSSGFSLNDCLHVGPKLQNELVDVLLQWRRHQFVFSCDLEKMYRQINVHPQDTRYQRILWRDTPDQHLQSYELKTVTYGLSCAPFLAIRCLRQLAEEHSKSHFISSNVLLKDTYVDDILSGADSINEVRQIMNDLNSILTAGGFHARKWISNCPSVIEHLPASDISTIHTLCFDENESPRTLGLSWNNQTDQFLFMFDKFHLNGKFTKRSVLSFIAKLYDPLGLLSPFIITAKIFMQELWVRGLEWDDELPNELSEKWANFQNDFQNIKTIRITRWLGLESYVLNVQIHGFADASSIAYGAVVYVRVEKLSEVRVVLMISKTKVAPLKTVTIPRLELCAAVVLTRLTKRVSNCLKLNDISINLWSDSSVALSWICSQPSKWKDFVRNRVVEIQDLPGAKWRFVPGIENPADLASRGVPISRLQSESIWWSGPSWLSASPHHWPSQSTLNAVEANREIKAVKVHHNTSNQGWDLKNNYSSLNRLLRVTSWCFRFTKTKKPNLEYFPDFITPDEIENSLIFWIKDIQNCYFNSEIRLLQEKKTIPKISPLYRLTPFLDGDGILRITGRLRFSTLDWDEKHPMILPKNSHFTNLVIDAHHRRTLHGGTQLTLSSIRRRFWILGGRIPVRSFIHRCAICARYRIQNSHQLMGQLPPSRVIPARPFLHSGVDYAGPFILKTAKGRGYKTYKSYLVIFICLATSAVHLEVATDYTTEGFLAAYKRFTGRRGLCQCIYSDCGTNLVGADKELRALFTAASKSWNHIAALLTNDGTKWKFNPPSAPHFGGKWEAGVRSTKSHLKKVMGSTLLTYEEFATVLIQIEAVLNSRPLIPLSDDPANYEALTPAHFLIGSSLTVVPEPSLLNLNINRLNRYQFLRRLVEEFWKKWSTYYLQTIQNSTKWFNQKNLPDVGSLVLLKDERLPPAKWMLARVLQLHEGADGKPRVATIKTSTSTLVRPLVKLCVLPTE